MRDNACYGRRGIVVGVRCRVRIMAQDLANWIREGLLQNLIVITCGGGEKRWSRIGVLV
jgi:hypothetical protein